MLLNVIVNIIVLEANERTVMNEVQRAMSKKIFLHI